MISNAFKGAYTERVQAENKVAGNIQRGIRDAASIATIAALGFTGAISDEAILKGVSRMGASRLGGIGGNAVMAALGEKKETAQVRKDDTRLLNADEEELDKIFTELSNQSTSEEMDTAIDTVWEKLNQGNKKKLNDKIKLNLQMFAKNMIDDENESYLEENQLNSIKSRGISGDRLLDANDLAKTIKDVGGEITKDGMVKLYHATTKESKEEIDRTGLMYGKEGKIYFSTKKDGEIKGYGDSVVEVELPIEELELNDLFDDEAHLTLDSIKPMQKVSIRRNSK